MDNFNEEFYDGEIGQQASQGIRLVCFGLICVDWIHNGDRKGFAGASTNPAQVFIEERRVRREPFWIIECVYSEHLIRYIRLRLGYLFCIEWVLVNPQMFG